VGSKLLEPRRVFHETAVCTAGCNLSSWHFRISGLTTPHPWKQLTRDRRSAFSATGEITANGGAPTLAARAPFDIHNGEATRFGDG
jgi:hypothetical protein